MKKVVIVLLSAMFLFSYCASDKSNEIAKKFGEMMCKSAELKKKYQDEPDSVKKIAINKEIEQFELDRKMLHGELQNMVKDVANDKDFQENFRKVLYEEIQKCQAITPEDREKMKKMFGAK